MLPMNEQMNNKTIKKAPELLAPAGDFQAFLGAINAGADAVYLAGNMFGARAYAKNLSTEEIVEALRYAHVHNARIYLTVNTLTKNEELKQLYDFLKPLYLAGLDGVIVQDFGVFSYIRDYFPGLKLHASTQMCITSYYGAAYLKELGAERVVPARELGLSEIKAINDLGIETECFIHGSMCYSYSGQCLFSSFLGGRSGNRGRCAGPCRQPYCPEGSKDEKYLLSLKDLCTIELLPKLIDAGISSFKIEGRMKSAAYAAGVTEVYRKYIDLYLNHPEKPYRVEQSDLEKLKSLYLRSDLQDGYYEKVRGREMVSIHSPSYNKTDDDLCAKLTEQYARKKVPVKVSAKAVFETGKPCEIVISDFGKSTDSVMKFKGENLSELSDSNEIIISGDTVLQAQNAPLKADDLKNRLSKSGEGFFSLEIEEISVSKDAFLPNKAINELRRKAEEQLFALRFEEGDKVRAESLKEDAESENSHDDSKAIMKDHSADWKNDASKESFVLFVLTKEQLQAAGSFAKAGDRICFPASFLYADDSFEEMKKIFNQSAFEKEGVSGKNGVSEKDRASEYYMVLPEVFREGNVSNLDKALKRAEELSFVKGYYVSGPDSLNYLKQKNTAKAICGDLAFYMANNESLKVFESELKGYTVSCEISQYEMKDLLKDQSMENFAPELMIYGRIPLMQSANCVLNTNGKCRKSAGFTYVSDRKRTDFPIYTHCDEKICYNTICNSVPLSLHKYYETIVSAGLKRLQIRFTDESSRDSERVYRIFDACRNGNTNPAVFYEYTNGHFKKGVL